MHVQQYLPLAYRIGWTEVNTNKCLLEIAKQTNLIYRYSHASKRFVEV